MKYCFLFIAILFSSFAFAQSGITVYVIDGTTRQPLPFAEVLVEKSGRQIGASLTYDNGYAEIKPLDPDKYDVRVIYEGYDTSVQRCVPVIQDCISSLTMEISKNGDNKVFVPGQVVIDTTKRTSLHINDTTLHTFECILAVPSYNYWGWSSGIFDRTDISRLPSTNPNYLLDFFPKR